MSFFKNGTGCCPVTAMSAYLTGTPTLKTDSPLFVDSKGARLTQAWVVERMRHVLDKAGLEGKDFSGISLRRGGARTILGLGASDKIIVQMGRWRSITYRRYLKVDDLEVEQWQRKMAPEAS